ncbi:hypothetical protein ACQKO5_09665 [Novosphingobium subterraneum]|uniref:hypothetical protein n=1 Tax=Novosphingobium subterraneum TaxID=48936 RepID=UPI003D08EFF2
MTALAAIAMLLAGPVVQVPPAPPAPKSGAFKCEMHARPSFGLQPTFTMTGRIVDWTKVSGKPAEAKLLLDAPSEYRLSGEYSISPKVGEMRFSSYDSDTKVTVSGVLNSNFYQTGTIVMTWKTDFGRPTEFVGLCDVKFSSEEMSR